MAVKIDFTPIESDIQFTEFTQEEPQEAPKEEAGFIGKVKKSIEGTKRDIGRVADIAKQAPVSLLRGAGGAYGGLLESLNLKEKLPESAYKAFQILGGAQAEQFPTPEIINKGLEALGIEPEAKTPAGRIIGKGIESSAETAAFAPLSPAFILASLLGGGVGESVRELGGPEGLASAIDVATSLAPGAKSIVGAVKAAKKIPDVTKAGITKLKGIGKVFKKPIEVSEKRFIKTSRLLEKDIKRELGRITDQKLPFSKIAKEDPIIYTRFDNAFKMLRNKAMGIEKEAFGGEKMFSTIDKSLNEARKIPSKSPSTKGYIKEMRRFRKDLAAKQLGALEWEQQYREINKGIRNLSKTVDLTGEKAGKLQALNELNKLTADSIATNFKNYPEFVQPFKSLNNAYSNLKNYEAVNKLIAPAFTEKALKPGKLIDAINSAKGKNTLTNALGKDGYKEVQDISKDLGDVSNLFDMLDVKKGDVNSLVPMLSKHIPIAIIDLFAAGAGKALHAAVLSKQIFTQARKMVNNMMISPAGRRNWKSAAAAIKNGDGKAFKAAAAKLKDIIKKDPEDIIEE